VEARGERRADEHGRHEHQRRDDDGHADVGLLEQAGRVPRRRGDAELSRGAPIQQHAREHAAPEQQPVAQA
jgi:hypothetical protein